MLHFASIRNLCAAALAAFALAVPADSQSPSGYTLIDLGAGGGWYSEGYAINNSGQVTGIYCPGGAHTVYAAFWSRREVHQSQC